uniref:Variant surface glycoprotein 1585 n=1 Tax=Trypanosoma brucei TaxID=5691 RepID=M4T0I0_9TRYP|nr:variant surface glycoprotein 1585 [Trypanosoma brucei]
MITGNVITTFPLALIAPAPQHVGGAVTALDDGAAFVTLCSIYNALTVDLKMSSSQPAIDALADDIAALNMSAVPSTLSDKINHEKAFAELETGTVPSKDPEKATWTKYYDYWRRGKAQLLKRRKDGEKLENSTLSPSARTQLAALAERAFQISAQAAQKKPEQRKTEYLNAAKRIIYNSDTADKPEPTAAGNDRANTCGKADGTAGNRAGKTLQEDFLCVCAKATNNNVGKVCCSNCDHGAANNAWASKVAGKATFAVLAAECQKHGPPATGSPGEITRAISTLYSQIADKKSTGNKQFVLGTLDGDGTSTADNGIYLIYRKSDTPADDHATIDWVSDALKADKALAEQSRDPARRA